MAESSEISAPLALLWWSSVLARSAVQPHSTRWPSVLNHRPCFRFPTSWVIANFSGSHIKVAELKWRALKTLEFKVGNSGRKFYFFNLFFGFVFNMLWDTVEMLQKKSRMRNLTWFFIFLLTGEWVGCWQNLQLGMKCLFSNSWLLHAAVLLFNRCSTLWH